MSAQRYQEKAPRRWLHQLWRMTQDELFQVLLVSLVVVAGTWVFVELAGDVLEGDTQAFDRWLLDALRSPENPDGHVGPAGWWKLAEISRRLAALWSSPS